ncbi:(2,3-dihydroxybenzoyl)adenylate synthase [Streptomyces sp. NPDC054933]
MVETHLGWPRADAERYRRLGYWTGRTFGAQLRAWAAARPGKTALVDGDRRWSYTQLDAAADRFAAGLRRLGLVRGDRVVLQLPNRADFVLLWFALQRIGAVPVHAMPAHRVTEIRNLIHTSGAVAYIIPDRHLRFDYRELACQLLHETTLRWALVDGDPGPHGDLIALSDLSAADGTPTDTGASASDLALLLLSGGTTGLPKLIPRTHDDYAYNVRAAAEASGLDEDAVYLASLPIGFNFTLACPGVLGVLMSGGTVVISPDPSPQTAFPLIEREGVTITALSPPLVSLWIDEHRNGTAALDTLRVLQVGGARLADHTARMLGPALGVRVQQVFGMAEGLICVTRLDDPEELICTTQGRPISPADEIRVVDVDGHQVPDGEPGELLVRGPYTLRGYYQAPEHNRTAFTADGFYRSGDVVRRLTSGHLVVVGRVKDQINRGGEKIASVEVEDHLATHPAITAAALVGVPDPKWGERSVAFLVCQGEAPRLRELAAFLRQRGLAAYKAPDQLVIVDELPLTAVGKVDKKVLSVQITQQSPAPGGAG